MHFDTICSIQDVILVYARISLCPPLSALRLFYKIQVHLSNLMFLAKRLIPIIISIVMIIIDPNHFRCLLYKPLIILVLLRLPKLLLNVLVAHGRVLCEQGHVHIVRVRGVPHPGPEVRPVVADYTEDVVFYVKNVETGTEG